MSNIPAKRSYYPALDGLRGTVCILVVVYHNFPFLHQYLFFGWLALDIFFVLSGFLITDILLNTFGEKNYLRNFYARRTLRVFPLYFTSLVLFLLILPRIPGLPIQLDYFVDHQAWFWTFTQNWLLIFHPSRSEFALNHLWSMAVEEQFYLLWPLLVAFVRKPKILFAIVSFLLLVFIVMRFWLWIHHFEGLAYYNFYTFTRIDGICIGCMVALLQKINHQFVGKNIAYIVFGFALFNFVFYLVNLQYQDSLPYLALVGFSTFSMILGLLVNDMINGHTPLITDIFNIRFLKFIGMISYGTYIFHWPLYLLLRPSLISWFQNHVPSASSQLMASTIASVLAFILGYFSYRYFELRFLKLKKHFA